MDNDYVTLLDGFGRRREPAFFAVDFDRSEAFVLRPEEAAGRGILFDVGGVRNYDPPELPPVEVKFEKSPVAFDEYRGAFETVREHLRLGNTYLANLTFSTPVETNLTLEDFFHRSDAKFRLLVPGRFAVFSPERFVTMRDGRISTCPMKGTIPASTPDAANVLLSDEKELAEHVTVVDLLRNDLARISKDVTVERFRYVEEVASREGPILQTSTEIAGRLDRGWQDRPGTILDALLPAGSVTGAPKPKTVEILRSAETHRRGFYTGVFGLFDGENLDSAVAIRFVERTDGGLVYKSGGGITVYSDARAEYKEMAGKVYVPFS